LAYQACSEDFVEADRQAEAWEECGRHWHQPLEHRQKDWACPKDSIDDCYDQNQDVASLSTCYVLQGQNQDVAKLAQPPLDVLP
jgi:hypothetical protein